MATRRTIAIRPCLTGEAELSAAGIKKVQEHAWAETYEYVFTRSPFFREHFRRAKLSRRKVVPLDELQRIPPIDKTTVSSRTSAFLCVPPKALVDVVTTSGSTGQPLVWNLTEADLGRLACTEERSFLCAGFSARDKVILAVALDRCFIAGMAYFLGLRRLGCLIARVGPGAPDMHLEMVKRLGATAIVGVPSFLCHLADRAIEKGINLARLGVRTAVCIGEPVRQQNFLLTAAGRRIQEAWGARVFSTYGVTELSCSLCECHAGQGGHLHPDLLYLEALDEEGRPVREGTIGEITATTFGVEAMPLIRYRTGDYAALYYGACSCGRRTLRVGPIVGRKNQKLKVKGTTLFPSNLKAILDTAAGVQCFVVLARSRGALNDEVEVRVACTGNERRVFEELRARFQAEVKVVPQLSHASTKEIEALQMPDGARKRRYFIDLRQ